MLKACLPLIIDLSLEDNGSIIISALVVIFSSQVPTHVSHISGNSSQVLRLQARLTRIHLMD